jgi:uncharacterized protein (UPF0332 family)
MSEFWTKALRMAQTARSAHRTGDYDSAANRAYYAMFNAARAGLDVVTDLEVTDVRRHTAVLQLFSFHLVNPGLVSATLSADLNKAFEGRAIADYERTFTSSEDSDALLSLMDRLIAELVPIVEGGKP